MPNWEHLGDGVGCTNREWLANVYPTFSWGIREINECAALARNNANCDTPLAISMDNDNCYCSLDTCDNVVSTWGGMKTFKELTDQPTGVSALSLSGEQYNSFGIGITVATSEPTPLSTSLSPTKVCLSSDRNRFFLAETHTVIIFIYRHQLKLQQLMPI